ncbi:hypothetical protein [Larkinella arboricola]|nr:hypothetical protein [Larkinella arboricola]
MMNVFRLKAVSFTRVCNSPARIFSVMAGRAPEFIHEQDNS